MPLLSKRRLHRTSQTYSLCYPLYFSRLPVKSKGVSVSWPCHWLSYHLSPCHYWRIPISIFHVFSISSSAAHTWLWFHFSSPLSVFEPLTTIESTPASPAQPFGISFSSSVGSTPVSVSHSFSSYDHLESSRELQTQGPSFPYHIWPLSSPIPHIYCHALTDPNWRQAMLVEYNAFIKNRTWDLVPRPTCTNVISGKWLYSHKFRSDGSLDRYRPVGWLVALINNP